MRSFELYVPKFDNDGKALEPELLEYCIRVAVVCGGGATSREAAGAWIGSDNQLFRDELHIICTDVADDVVDSTRAAFVQVASIVKARMEQEAVYVRDFALVSTLV